MKIAELYIHPIKALRGISVPSVILDIHGGFAHDRHFMLYRVQADGTLKSMHASSPLETGLFSTDLADNDSTIVVKYNAPEVPVAPPAPSQLTELRIPLRPEIDGLKRVRVEFNDSPTSAYDMGMECRKWFSECFGYEVLLAYLGDGKRKVLGTLAPNARNGNNNSNSNSWFSTISSYVPGASNSKAPDTTLGFTDVASLLVVNQASLEDCHPRLDSSTEKQQQGDENKTAPIKMNVRKFRPNIVFSSPSEPAWSEDYWSTLEVSSSNPSQSPINISLTHNCGRCLSINVDYTTGKESKGPEGQMLKRLMRDRRVDKGVKYSPVFGRYGFVVGDVEGRVLSVGDEVVVTGRNDGHTVFDWPGLTN